MSKRSGLPRSPDDRIYMGNAVVVRLHMDELVELIRWIEEDERE